MKNRKLFATGLAVFIILSLVLSGCARKKAVNQAAEYKSRKYRIGFVMQSYNNDLLNIMMNEAKKEAEKLDDTDVIFVNGKSDATKQKLQIANLIAQKCDAIIVNPYDINESASYTKMANDSNVPIISVNTPLKNQDEATAYVGSDSTESGVLEMEYAAKKLNGKGNIVILRGNDTDEAAIKRTQAIKVVIKKYPNIKIVAEESGKWLRTYGMQITENWIKKGIQFDAVVANNDEMAIGSIMALKNANMIDRVFVAGIDGNKDALNLLKEGSLKVTVFQNVAGQGSEAIKTAYKVIKGEKVDKNIFIPFELVTHEDADKCLAKYN